MQDEPKPARKNTAAGWPSWTDAYRPTLGPRVPDLASIKVRAPRSKRPDRPAPRAVTGRG